MTKVADRNQRQLHELLKLPGNNVCADCSSLNPRWSSYNLGIFICQTCAGIHRKMGTHISKVKSLSLDTWSREQVNFMRDSGGNEITNGIYLSGGDKGGRDRGGGGAVDEGERNSMMEKFIRNKYEFKIYMSSSPSTSTFSSPAISTYSLPLPPPRPSSSSSSTTHSTLSSSDRRPSTPSSSIASPSAPSIALAQIENLSTRSRSTSSPDSTVVKQVRFTNRSNSVPIPEIVTVSNSISMSMSRSNSRLEGIQESSGNGSGSGVKPIGILRGRSQTLNALPSSINVSSRTSSFSNNPYSNVGGNFISNNSIYPQPPLPLSVPLLNSNSFIQPPSLPNHVQPLPSRSKIEIEQPRMNSSIWDDIDILAGKQVSTTNLPPIRSYSTPLPQIQTYQFQPSSQFGQQQQQQQLQQQQQFGYQNGNQNDLTSPFDHSFNMSPFTHAIQQQQPQYSSAQYPIAISSPSINYNYNSNPFMNMNSLNQTLPSTSYPQSYPQQLQQSIYSPPLQNVQSPQTQSISNLNPFFQPQPQSQPQQQIQQSTNPYSPQYSPLPRNLSNNQNQSIVVDQSNPFTFLNQPQSQSQVQQPSQQQQFFNPQSMNGYY